MTKKALISAQTEASAFAGRVEVMYREEPYRLLGLVRRLREFGVLDKNLIVKKILSWYLKGEFAQKRDCKLLRNAPDLLEASYHELVEVAGILPATFISDDGKKLLARLLEH